MLRYRWPGNVRELKNVIERAVVLARGELIELEDLTLSKLATAGDTADVVPSAANRSSQCRSRKWSAGTFWPR